MLKRFPARCDRYDCLLGVRPSQKHLRLICFYSESFSIFGTLVSGVGCLTFIKVRVCSKAARKLFDQGVSVVKISSFFVFFFCVCSFCVRSSLYLLFIGKDSKSCFCILLLMIEPLFTCVYCKEHSILS